MNTNELDAVNKAAQALGLGLAGMTWERWKRFSDAEREALRDLSDLSPQLTGMESCRVEVTTEYGDTRRFWVGRSMGWKPVHIEIARRDSTGGVSAEKHYQSVRIIYAASQRWRK